MDPLSDVLALLKPRNTMCGGFDAGGDWAWQYPEHQGIKCYAVVSGECWLAVDGVAEPARLTAGDCFLLPLGRPFRLASDLSLPTVDFRELLKSPLNGALSRGMAGAAALVSVDSSAWREIALIFFSRCSRQSSTFAGKPSGRRSGGRSNG